jgi:hypothetical protein
MLLARMKNGKEYRCDQCQKLLGFDETHFYNDAGAGEMFHFCTQKHVRLFIINRYNLPLPFPSSAQTTGNVIPVKNPGDDK